MEKLKTGRKPVNIMTSAKHLRGREALWPAIRKMKTFTPKELINETSICNATTRSFIESLFKSGYLSREEISRNGAKIIYKYNLVKDTGIDTPRLRRDGSKVLPTSQEYMWRSMRIIKRFSLKDLILNASTDEVKISPISAEDYLKHLTKAGYLIKHSDKTFSFLESKYSGPKAPMIQRVKNVFDPNLGKVVWPLDNKEDCKCVKQKS